LWLQRRDPTLLLVREEIKGHREVAQPGVMPIGLMHATDVLNGHLINISAAMKATDIHTLPIEQPGTIITSQSVETPKFPVHAVATALLNACYLLWWLHRHRCTSINWHFLMICSV
jgi:hypothetical protein